MATKARYAGTCGRCKGPIKVDQWIEENHWDGWVHWKKFVCRKIQARRLSNRVSRFLDTAWNGRNPSDDKLTIGYDGSRIKPQQDGGYSWYSANPNDTKGDN